MPRMDRRRRHDFKKFREQLERLDSEDIRERLNSNRIRSTQRRALAEQVLRERAQAAQAARSEAEPAARRPRATRNMETEEAAAAAPGGGAAGRPREAAASAYDARRRAAERGQTAVRREDLPTARQLGCALCMLMVLGGMAVIMAGLLRR